jgi:hypothetical protein
VLVDTAFECGSRAVGTGCFVHLKPYSQKRERLARVYSGLYESLKVAGVKLKLCQTEDLAEVLEVFISTVD